MELFWWFFTIVLFAIGLLGTVVPFLPGTTIILAGAIIHRMMLGADKSISWIMIAGLSLLTLVSYGLDFLGGYYGAKRFGATRWGTFGAIIGAVVGLFFGIIGLFVGPVIGALVGEFIAGKRLVDAGRATVLSDHRLEEACWENPFVQWHAADTHRMLQGLTGTGGIAVDRNAEAVNAKFCHLISCRCPGRRLSRQRLSQDRR